jgi:hypothetical protein
MACCAVLPSGSMASGKSGRQRIRTWCIHPGLGLERKSCYRDFKGLPLFTYLTFALIVMTKCGIPLFCPPFATPYEEMPLKRPFLGYQPAAASDLVTLGALV